MIVLKALVVVAVTAATVWLYLCVLRCCCAVWPATAGCRGVAKALQVTLLVARALAGDAAATGGVLLLAVGAHCYTR